MEHWGLDVQTGEIRTGSADQVLTANGIGSCVVIGLYDPLVRTGGLAHIMLAGKSRPEQDGQKLRYLENAVEALLEDIGKTGGNKANLRAFLAGAGNVLKRADDAICSANIDNAQAVMAMHGIVIAGQSLGGVERRRIRFELDTGKVYCAVGDNPEQLLCRLGRD